MRRRRCKDTLIARRRPRPLAGLRGHDRGLLDRLAREAIGEARDAAATEGYFSAHVEVSVDRASDPVTVTLAVDAGAPTRIRDVHIVVTGPAATDMPARHRRDRAAAADDWRLPRRRRLPAGARGSIAKAARRRHTRRQSATRRPQLARAKRAIDPDAHAPTSSSTIASGPPFHFGDARDHRGSRSTTPTLVRNFSTIRSRRPVQRRATLDQLRPTPERVGLFRERAGVDRSRPRARRTTRRSRRGDRGADRSGSKAASATRPTRSFARKRQLPRREHRRPRHCSSTPTRASSRRSRAGRVRFVPPPNAGGWIDTRSTSGASAPTSRTSSRARPSSARAGAPSTSATRWRFGDRTTSTSSSRWARRRRIAHALYVDCEHTWRRVDDLVAPTRGYMANVQLGAGDPGRVDARPSAA